MPQDRLACIVPTDGTRGGETPALRIDDHAATLVQPVGDSDGNSRATLPGQPCAGQDRARRAVLAGQPGERLTSPSRVASMVRSAPQRGEGSCAAPDRGRLSLRWAFSPVSPRRQGDGNRSLQTSPAGRLGRKVGRPASRHPQARRTPHPGAARSVHRQQLRAPVIDPAAGGRTPSRSARGEPGAARPPASRPDRPPAGDAWRGRARSPAAPCAGHRADPPASRCGRPPSPLNIPTPAVAATTLAVVFETLQSSGQTIESLASAGEAAARRHGTAVGLSADKSSVPGERSTFPPVSTDRGSCAPTPSRPPTPRNRAGKPKRSISTSPGGYATAATCSVCPSRSWAPA